MWIFKERNVVVKEVNPPPLLRVLTMVRVLIISDISMNAQDGPRRPKLQKYPPCMFGA